MTKTRSNQADQTTLYYYSTSKLGKKALATVQATDAEVLSIDIKSTKVSGMKWIKLAKQLEINVLDLINQEHPVYRDLYGNKKVVLKAEDALKMLEQHPEVLVYPIAIRGDRAIQVKTSTDLHQLVNPDSGGIPQPKTDV